MPCDEGAGSEEKKDSGGAERAVEILRRAVSQVYSAMRKNMDSFFAAHVDSFLPDEAYDPEKHDLKGRDAVKFLKDFGDCESCVNPIEWTRLHEEYENIIDGLLEEFVAAEGFSSFHDFIRTIQDGCDEDGNFLDDSGRRMLNLLCAATDYRRFVRIMRLKALTLWQKGGKMKKRAKK